MSEANLYGAIETVARAQPARAALTAESGERFTYADIDAWSARYANCLVQHGLERGDRVAVQIDKSPHSLFLYLACLRAGLVYLPLNTAYQRAELDYFVSDAQPRLIVSVPQNESLLRELGRSSPGCAVQTMDQHGAGTFAQSASNSAPSFDTAEVGPEELAVIIYTSGTTGRPKGAMITHRNLTSNARALISIWGFTAGDVLLHALPIFHVHGLFVANHCALLSGAAMLWQHRFEPRSVIAALGRATVFMGVPTYYVRLLADKKFGREHCAGMRLFVSGSAALLPETHREFEARTGHRILERYGMSEAGMIASNPLDGERRPGTVGHPLPGVKVRIAGAGDRVLATGETGAIQIKGENVFSGYWRMPEKTAEDFTADGWFRSGDMGVFDGDGYLSIAGREKDLIITGGYNVYPKEIERLIDSIPGIAESAVIGIPHAEFGEAVVAVVVPKPGAHIEEREVIAAVRAQLANYKVPKRVFVSAELPRNAMGKVQKNSLRGQYAGV